MGKAEQLAKQLEPVLDPILDRSGYVLYSSAESVAPCSLYLLGHNPGGSPEDQADATVRASLAALPHKTINNYLDETWTTASGRTWGQGQAPLQRRVVWLLEALGFDARKVPCSNLIFVRSVDVAGSTFDSIADLCWKAHELILQTVDPKLLIVFGNSTPSPYRYLRGKWSNGPEEVMPSGHGDWMCRRFTGSNGRIVVGLPHLSRYNVVGKTSVVEWVRQAYAL